MAHGGERVGAHPTLVNLFDNGVNVTQVLAETRAGYSQRTLGYSPRTAQPGGGECYVVTPTLKVVQKVLKCDVALLSIYNSDWSQKGKFISCSIITLDV